MKYSPQYTIEQMVRIWVLGALAHYKGNRTHAAKALGISIRGIRNQIIRFGLARNPTPGEINAYTYGPEDAKE